MREENNRNLWGFYVLPLRINFFSSHWKSFNIWKSASAWNKIGDKNWKNGFSFKGWKIFYMFKLFSIFLKILIKIKKYYLKIEQIPSIVSSICFCSSFYIFFIQRCIFLYSCITIKFCAYFNIFFLSLSTSSFLFFSSSLSNC